MAAVVHEMKSSHKARCRETLATASQRATALTCRVWRFQKASEGSSNQNVRLEN